MANLEMVCQHLCLLLVNYEATHWLPQTAGRHEPVSKPIPAPVLPLPGQEQMSKVPLQVLTHHGPVPFLPEPSV